jgi:hypothetical protein
MLDLVRGDAFRLLGREIAARRLFLGAIDALDARGSGPETTPARFPAKAAPPAERAAPPTDGQVPLPFGVPSGGSDPSGSTEPEAS